MINHASPRVFKVLSGSLTLLWIWTLALWFNMKHRQTNNARPGSRIYPVLVTLIYTRSSIGIVATVVNASILVFIVWDHVSHRRLVIWFSMLLLVSLIMPVFLSFCIPALAPIALRFFTIGGDLHIAMGAMVCGPYDDTIQISGFEIGKLVSRCSLSGGPAPRTGVGNVSLRFYGGRCPISAKIRILTYRDFPCR
jgi:hypothetical protein